MKTCQNKKKCKSCIINHLPRLKCLIFLCFWVELCKTLGKDGQEIKILTHMKKFHFWVKMLFLSKTKMNFWKILIFGTHGLMTIFSKCSKFQNDLINILGDMTSSILILFGIALFCIISTQNNVIPIGWYFKMSYYIVCVFLRQPLVEHCHVTRNCQTMFTGNERFH